MKSFTFKASTTMMSGMNALLLQAHSWRQFHVIIFLKTGTCRGVRIANFEAELIDKLYGLLSQNCTLDFEGFYSR